LRNLGDHGQQEEETRKDEEASEVDAESDTRIKTA
jgi:hypothetical protein